MVKKRKSADELERFLAHAAEVIGSTLGKVAIKTGLAKSASPASMASARKTASPKAVGVNHRHKPAKAKVTKAPVKKPSRGKKSA